MLDDSLDEDAETFTVVLRDASHGIQLERSQATATIEDNDGPPSVSVAPASVAEGDTSLTDAKLKVRLSEPSGKPVAVAFATADGSAKNPGDYAPASGKLVLAPGEIEAVVHVAVRGDAAIEPDEALVGRALGARERDARRCLGVADDRGRRGARARRDEPARSPRATAAPRRRRSPSRSSRPRRPVRPSRSTTTSPA